MDTTEVEKFFAQQTETQMVKAKSTACQNTQNNYRFLDTIILWNIILGL